MFLLGFFFVCGLTGALLARRFPTQPRATLAAGVLIGAASTYLWYFA